MSDSEEPKQWVPKPPIMTIESLLDYGFKEWPVAEHDKHERHFQFCKRDQKGKKLYIQVRFWEFSKYSSKERGTVLDSFDAQAQFDMNGPKTFEVTLSVNDMSPNQVVEWFEHMHNVMGCTYYELYADDQYNEDGEQTSYNCDKCGRYLAVEDSISPFLCPGCKYEQDSGFKPVVRKVKVRRR